MRREFYEKNGILVTYTDDDVAFEDLDTAESILIANDGSIIHNNFEDDPKRTEYFVKEFEHIYQTVSIFRSLDSIDGVA